MMRVLVVEDHAAQRLAVVDALTDEGYEVLEATTLADTDALLEEQVVDAIVLDVMLPDGNGYEWCRRFRETGRRTPVLMLTARTLEEDLVRGFAEGADDYLAKPVRLSELLARLKARCRGGPVEAQEREVVRLGRASLEPSARRLRGPDGREIHLTPREFEVLELFSRRPGEALSRDQILAHAWGDDVHVGPRTVDNFVHQLNRKLTDSELRIRSVRGFGYRLDPGPAPPSSNADAPRTLVPPDDGS